MGLLPILRAQLAGAIALGCAGDPTQPSSETGIPAAAVASNERTQLVNTFAFSFCTEEFIPLTGTSHEVISETETGGGVFHLRIHFKIHAVATSPTTGQSFVVNMIENFIFPDLNFFFEGTDQSTVALVTKGGSSNEVVRFKYHLTINANGTITSSLEDFTIRCT